MRHTLNRTLVVSACAFAFLLPAVLPDAYGGPSHAQAVQSQNDSEAEAPATTVQVTNIVTPYGVPATLPTSVMSIGSDFAWSEQAVVWNEIDPHVFVTAGTHEIAGTVTATKQPVTGSITVFPAGQTIKVAAVGDSITAGMGTTNSNLNSYPGQLDSMLGSAFTVKNFGVSGYTVLTKGDAPYRNHSYFTQSKTFQPDIVLFQLGTNDSKPQNWRYADQLVENYRAFIREYRSLPSKPKVYAMLPPAVKGNGAYGITENGVNLVIKKIIEALSTPEFANVTIIDNNTPFRAAFNFLPDTVHPNNDGAMLLANNVRRHLVGDTAAPHSRKMAAAQLSDTSGMHLVNSSDESGYQRLTSIHANDWVSYSGVNFDRNTSNTVYARTATPYTDVTMNVRIDSPSGDIIASQIIPRTGGLDSWNSTLLATIPISGTHDVYLSFTRPGAPATQDLASLSWVNLTPNDRAAFPGFGLGWDTIRPSEQDIVPLPDGGLGITSTRGELYGSYNNARNVVVHDVGAGDFVASLRLDSQAVGSNALAGLIVYFDDNNYFGAVRKSSGRPYIGGINEVNGGYGERLIVDPAPDAPIYLRVERKGDVMTASYSADNKAWKPLWENAKNGSFQRLTELKVGPYAPRGVGAGTDNLVRFGVLSVNGVTVPYFDEASGYPQF